MPLASYEYLAETTRAVFNMVAHDVLVQYPDLRIVVPHCGSLLPNALPRFKGLLPVVAGARNMGVTDKELMALPALLEDKVGLDEAQRLRAALHAVFGD